MTLKFIMDHSSHFGVQVPEGYRDNLVTENDQTRLVYTEPIPLAADDIPPWIQDNENVIVDHEPVSFYQRFKKLVMLFYIGLFVSLMVLYLGYRNVNDVMKYSSLKITEIGEVEFIENGLRIDDLSAEFYFEKKGYFNWMNNFNNTDVLFITPIEIFADSIEIASIDLNENIVAFQLIGNVWNLRLNNFTIDINGDALKYVINEKKDIFNIKLHLSIWERVLHFSKTLRVSPQNLQGSINNIFDILLKNAVIEDLNISQYNEVSGILGNARLTLPTVYNFPAGSGLLGFDIDEVFHSFMKIDFFQNGSAVGINFVIFNVDPALIQNGNIADLVWRLFNDDNELQPSTITVHGTKVRDAPPWFVSLWKQLALSIDFRFASFHYNSGSNKFPDHIPTEIEQLSVRSEAKTGDILLENRLFILMYTLFDWYEIATAGAVQYGGFNITFSQKILKNVKGPLTTVANTVQIHVDDVVKSTHFVQQLLNNETVVENMVLDINNNIKSPFYNGELQLQAHPLVNAKAMINRFVQENIMHKQVELIDINILDKANSLGSLRFYVKSMIQMPSYVENFSNKFKKVAVIVNFNSSSALELSLFETSGKNGYLPIDFIVSVNASDVKGLNDFENLASQFISGVPVNISISATDNEGKMGIPECNQNFNDLLKNIDIPINMSIDNISGSPDGGSYFIRDTTMHVVSREVEMVLFNPISNSEITLEILEGEAIREGFTIGYLKEPVTWLVQPGIWNTPKVKVEYANTGSVGWSMIEDAIRGDGVMKNLTVKGVIRVKFKQYPEFPGFTISYLSSGPKSGKVRWIL